MGEYGKKKRRRRRQVKVVVREALFSFSTRQAQVNGSAWTFTEALLNVLRAGMCKLTSSNIREKKQRSLSVYWS